MKKSCLEFEKSLTTTELTNHSTEQFFAQGTNRWGIKFLTIGEYFERVFVQSSVGATPEVIAPVTLNQYDLIERSRFNQIYAELGGREAALTIGQLAALLASHPEEKGGDWLLVAVINPIDPNMVCEVCCVWYVAGWSVEAGSIPGPVDWSVGRKIFSRILEPSDLL